MKWTRLVGAWWLVLALGGAPLGWAAPTPAHGPFNADFVQERYLPGLSQPIVNRGNVHFGADGTLRWEVTQPYHYVFDANGNTAYEILPDGTRRSVDPASAPWLGVMQRILAGLLAGNEAELARYFKVTGKPGAGATRELTLTPLAGALGNSIERVEVVADAANRARRVDITQRAGGRIRIEFQPVAGH